MTLADVGAHHPARALLTGRTPAFASQVDQRFSYSLYVPDGYDDATEPYRLLVAVHGTRRRAEALREGLISFADRNRCVVLTPLFPAGIEDPNDVHNYKFIDFRGIRFDTLLLSMVDEVQERYNVDAGSFAICGFSGGGQFAHRFLYLHPERLAAVSIGAPGRVTMPDTTEPWWQGVADLEERLGVPFDAHAVAAVPTQIVVGELDDDPADIASVQASGGGATRLQRARALAEALSRLGGNVTLDILPGLAHEGLNTLPAVTAFFERVVWHRDPG